MTELDRISELPRDIKDNILVRLPVKEAVRTCCLSSKWRLAWSSIPELVYDENSISISDTCSDENLVKSTKKMVQFLDKFLSLHDGSIRKFVIASAKPFSKDRNRWLIVLMIEEQKEFCNSEPVDLNKWKVPSNFWNLQCLMEVVLSDCYIKLPRAFKGFELLKSLSLEKSVITEGDLTNLIASCPLLESLDLFGNMHGMNIRIHAPMLKQLSLICWQLKHVCLRTPSVVRVVLDLAPNLLQRHRWIDLLNCLPNLEMLHLRGQLMRYFAYGFDMELSIKFYHLKSLNIKLNFAIQKEAVAVRQLFRHAPNLQELTIEEQYSSNTKFTEEWTQYTILEHLKFVEIGRFWSRKSTLLLVTFLLASTPVLEELHFKHEIKNPKIIEKLVRLKRASKNAQIFNSGIKLPKM